MKTKSIWEYMPLPTRMNIATRYLIALLVLTVATLVRMSVDSIVGELHPFVTYVFATIFTAWCCGFWPATLTLVLGFLAAAYFFVSPRGSFAMHGIDVQVGVVLYVVVGFSSILLSQLMHIANQNAEAKSLQLERKQFELQQEVQQRRAAEDEKVSILRRFVDMQEEERRRISRELHDQCGQDIVALKLGIKRACDIAKNKGAISISSFQEVNELLDRLSKEIHDLAFDLRPLSLDELGLRTAAETFLKQWQYKTGIEVDFECRNWDANQLSSESSLALFRVLQESLTNVAKHAKCRKVSVVIELKREMAVEIIEDQGKGFDLGTTPDVNQVRQSLGIQGMRERLAAVGGSLEIESCIGKGTTVFARVPRVSEGSN